MNSLKRSFQVSLEEDTADQELGVIVEPGELEAVVDDIEAQQREADDASDDVEALGEAAQGLESLIAASESSLLQGGLDVASADIMRVAVESIYSRVEQRGVVFAKAALPSIEAYGRTSTRRVTTKANVEELKANLKKLWEAVKNTAKKAWDAVVAVAGRIFNSAESLMTRATALQEAKVEGKADGKITVPNAITYAGKSDVASIKKGLSAVAAFTVVLGTKTAELITKAKEAGEKGNSLSASDIASLGFKETVLSGGRTYSPIDGNLFNIVVSESKGSEINVPSLSDIKAIGKSAYDIADAFKTHKDAVANIQRAVQDLNNAVDGMVSKEDDSKAMTASKNLMRFLRSGASNHCVKQMADQFKTATAAVQFGERCLKQYKIAKTEEAA